jgi:hypothetical protein
MSSGPSQTQTQEQEQQQKQKQNQTTSTQASTDSTTNANTVGHSTTQNVADTTSQQAGVTTGHTEQNPYAASEPLLQSIIDQAQSVGIAGTNLSPTETAALQGVTGAAETAAGFAPQITQLAADKFNGAGFGAGEGEINNAYDMAKSAYERVLSGDMTGENNPYLQTLLGTIQDRVRNNVGSAFANAGRSFSGAHAGALAEGMSKGMADPLFQNYWKERDAQMGAAQGLQSGALARSTALDAIRSNILGARDGAADTLKSLYDPYSTMLEAGKYSREAPLQALGMLSGIGTQMAGVGGSTDSLGTSLMLGQQHGTETGTTDSTQNMTSNTSTDATSKSKTKGSSTLKGSTTGTTTTTQESDPLMTGAGLLLGGAGLLLNPMPAGSTTLLGSML